MNGKLLLDTNIVIALFAEEATIKKRLDEAEKVFVPSIVLGELYYGAYNSGKIAENLAKVEQFAVRNTVLACKKGTAQHYGQMKRVLQAKGRPLPENDIWIAAMAQQYGFTLLTRDSHFKEIDGLLIEIL